MEKTITQSNELFENKIPELTLLKVSTIIGLKTLVNSRKWIIYIIIAFLPLTIAALVGDPLLGEKNAQEAYLNYFVAFNYNILFGFGVLFIALPLSSDEISDHVTDLYLVRPIRRETYWVSRVIATTIGVFVVTMFVSTFYYFYFNLFDDPSKLVHNSEDYLASFIFIGYSSIIYSGLYLLVTSTKKSGFTYGVVFAIIEQFFLSSLFLSNNRYVPKNNTLRVAKYFYSDTIDFSNLGFNPSSNFDIVWSMLYFIFFTLGIYVLGAYYYREREFN